jgi:aminomuconate-semialdehyde/2-hydroxymuconate-6-semialdehyde dehydrogenase
MAMEAAKAAFPLWSDLPSADRANYMERIALLIEENREELAAAESRDNGKPVKLAYAVDIPRASKNMRFYATAIQHYASDTHQTGNEAINYTIRKPLGVVGCISPWNLPLYLFTWKIAPALAAGNTVVAKPSELTPATAYMFTRLCAEAGLPPGVLNVVHGKGSEAGEAIVSHPLVKAISFTGGTATGRKIAATAAPAFKKLSLELGGKNPTVVFADCDFDETVRSTVRAAFANQGEICLCGSRILVERSIYDEFVESYVARVGSLKVGDPMDDTAQMGALVSEDHLKKVRQYVSLAREEGGQVLTGGESIRLEGRCAEGYFHEPTVITGLPMSCRTNQEEIFGPVVTITPFGDENEAVSLANDCAYGLSANIWTNDLKRAHRVAQHIEAGIIWVNCWLLRDLRTPFGGMKQSGMGREGGWYALDFFTEPKNICIKL